MTKTPIGLQDLRRRIYLKAKADKGHRFWGLYVHVVKIATLFEAYRAAKSNNGAPGIDGVTFEAIEQAGVEEFVATLHTELVNGTYFPLRSRKKEIPKEGSNKTRTLSIPTIRDRVVQGALKLILEPIFEADFQDGSYGYRPKRSTYEANQRVAAAVVRQHTRVIDIDLKDFFGSVEHTTLLKKIAERVDDDEIMRLLKLILKSTGKKGLPQGGPISPLLSNLYLNEVDKMLERAKEYSRNERGYTHLEYARFADDLVVLIDGHWRWEKLSNMVYQRLKQELGLIGVELNLEKTKIIDLKTKTSFPFLGFDFRRCRTLSGKWGALFTPRMKARTKLLRQLKEIFRQHRSQPIRRIISLINPILRGWTNYYRVGHASRCFGYVQNWVEKKVRRHLMHSRGRSGFGWKRWSRSWLYEVLGLFNDYKVSRPKPASKVGHAK